MKITDQNIFTSKIVPEVNSFQLNDILEEKAELISCEHS